MLYECSRAAAGAADNKKPAQGGFRDYFIHIAIGNKNPQYESTVYRVTGACQVVCGVYAIASWRGSVIY